MAAALASVRVQWQGQEQNIAEETTIYKGFW
jgi:hypothetical protein